MKTIHQEIVQNLLIRKLQKEWSHFGEDEQEHTLQNQCTMKS